VALGRAQPRLKPDLSAFLYDPFGARVQIAAMLRLGGDARKPDVIAKLVDEPRLVAFEILKNCLHRQRFSRTSTKFQIPKPKSQTNPKSQAPKPLAY
jgi:hypothetical protein